MHLDIVIACKPGSATELAIPRAKRELVAECRAHHGCASGVSLRIHGTSPLQEAAEWCLRRRRQELNAPGGELQPSPTMGRATCPQAHGVLVSGAYTCRSASRYS